MNNKYGIKRKMKIKLNITYTKKKLIFLKEHLCEILSEINLSKTDFLIDQWITNHEIWLYGWERKLLNDNKELIIDAMMEK